MPVDNEVGAPLFPPKCFVIAPIGDKDAEIGHPSREIWENTVELFEEVIQPACNAFGLEPIRADRIARTGEIPEQICMHLRDDEVVIADLTGGNPNVMYELGLRHTTGKLTIQLGEKGKLPFDVAAIRTIKFQRSERGLVEARKRLSEALSVGLMSGGDSVTATRIWLDRPALQVKSTDDEESDEPGFLEKLADLEEHVERLPASMTVVGEIMSSMNDITTKIGERAIKANASGAPTSVKLSLANQLAESLTPHVSRLEQVVTDFELAVEKVELGIMHILGASPQNQEEEEAIRSFRNAIKEILPSVQQYIKSASGLNDRLKDTGEISRSIRKVNGRTRKSLAKLIAASGQIIRWADYIDAQS
jgi:hypothetical protein